MEVYLFILLLSLSSVASLITNHMSFRSIVPHYRENIPKTPCRSFFEQTKRHIVWWMHQTPWSRLTYIYFALDKPSRLYIWNFMASPTHANQKKKNQTFIDFWPIYIYIYNYLHAKKGIYINYIDNNICNVDHASLCFYVHKVSLLFSFFFGCCLASLSLVD